jgi:spermidine synthase
MCKAHLKPGGVMTVWIPLYESNLATAKSMIGSFFKVFPDGVIWSNDSDGEGYDAVLFGQAESAPIDIDKIQTRLGREAYEPVKKSLADVGFRSWVSLLATYAARAADLKDWLKDAQINTDHNLRLQYLAGLSLNTYRGSEILADIRQHYRFPDRLFSGSDRALLMVKYAIDGLPQDK